MWAFGQEYLSLNISNTLALGMGLNSVLDYIYCARILNGMGDKSPHSPLNGGLLPSWISVHVVSLLLGLLVLLIFGTVKFFCSQHSHMVPIFFHRFLCDIFLCVFSHREKWISYSIMDMSLISG